MGDNRKVLFIDNFDSFTYNLVDDFCKRNCQAKVYRSDTELTELKAAASEFVPDLLVISPGPGTPDTAGVLTISGGLFQRQAADIRRVLRSSGNRAVFRGQNRSRAGAGARQTLASNTQRKKYICRRGESTAGRAVP